VIGMGEEAVGRGMVLEVRGRSALVLADGGEFRWIPLQGQPGELGQEVRFVRRRSLALRPLLRPALVMATLVGLLALTPRLGAPGPVAARISLDINPSFELAVDARERVVEAIGVDDSGRELVKAAGAVRGRDLGTALERLLHVAREHRYLDPAGSNVLVVAVTRFLPGQEGLVGRIEALGERVKVVADRELAGAAAVTIASLQVSPAVWQEARSVGLSAGRYAVLLRAQGRGLALEVEDLRQGRLGEAIGRAGGVAAEIVAGDDPLEVLEELAEKFRERNRARRSQRDEGDDERPEEDDEDDGDEDGEDGEDRRNGLPGRPAREDEEEGEEKDEPGHDRRPIDRGGPPAPAGRARQDVPPPPPPPGRGRPGEREDRGDWGPGRHSRDGVEEDDRDDRGRRGQLEEEGEEDEEKGKKEESGGR
jgi:hypothetical protein